MLHTQSITRMFLIITITIAIFLGIATAVISILTQYNSFQQASRQYEKAYLKTQKSLIQNEVIKILNHIEYEKSLAERRLRKSIREQVQEMHTMAITVYEKNKTLKPHKEIQTLIVDMVSLIKHHGDEYFWIITPQGTVIFHPFIREKSVEQLPGDMQKLFYNAANAVSDGKDGAFYEYYWKKLGQNIPLRKVSYFMLFKPYNWIICTGASLPDLERDIQKEVLEHLEHITFGREGSIQAFTFDGTVLADPSQSFPVGENVLEITDANGVKIVQQILEAGLHPEGGYISYLWAKNKLSAPRTKLVFSKTVYDWGWIVTAGVFADEIDTMIAEHRNVLKAGVMRQIRWSMGLFLLVLISGILAAYIFSRHLRNEFRVFIAFFENVSHAYAPIDKEQLSSKEFKVLADYANDMRDEIVRSRRDLSKSEERYRTLVEAIPYGIQEIDTNGIITFINPAYDKMYGYDHGELTGKSMLDMIATDSEKSILQEYLDIILKEQPEPVPYFGKVLKKDGYVFDVQTDWEYKRDEHGRITGFISVITDITERKQAREEIQKLNLTLEQKVAERTQELHETIRRLHWEIAERERTERELQHAKEAAESANLAKSIFLANMSHELRTPLNAILGFAQIMSHSRTDNPEQRENLAVISRNGEHLLTLINQVLDLSKIEAGRITLDERNFDLHNMLSELENMFRVQADNKALRLVFSHAGDVPRHIRTDEVRLRQVLINLLNNALKFTKEGGVTVRAGIADSEDCKSGIRKLRFEIEDTGSGIASEESDMLFEAFVQTETGRQAQEGTGLGLPISRNFVRLMGGDITVRSEPGRGTTFTFDIQAGIAEAAETETIPAARRAVAPEPGQPRHRILIADDKADNRRVLDRLLSPFGFALREAGNGQEATEIWDRWKPHLIWMDIRMPVMSGYEAVRKIRNQESGIRHTVIIAVSASAYEEERAVAISEGCDDFLRKPFREADIFEMMSRHAGIRFIYEDDRKTESRRQGAESKKMLTPEMLAVLPDDVLAEFRRVAEIADIRTVKRLTEQIRTEHESLADALTELLEDFRFDTLQELFGKGE